MEKGKLIIKLSRNGYFVEVQFTNGRKQPCPGFKPKNDELNGKDIEIDRTPAGAIKSIYYDGKVIYPEQGYIPKKQANDHFIQEQSKKSNQNEQERFTKRFEKKRKIHDQPKGTAYSPYNFVPLNHRVLSVYKDELVAQNKYYQDRYTGYIDLNIINKTPLYIRGKESEFYKSSGLYCIPGSSLRGMIRTLVEIVTNGKFLFFENKRLYYRDMAGKTNRKKEYNENMSSWDKTSKSSQYKMKAGILRKINLFEYQITPVGGYKEGFFPIRKTEARIRINKLGKKYKPFNNYEFSDEYIVVSGSMFNPKTKEDYKKNDWVVKKKSIGIPIKLKEIDILEYRSDINRQSKEFADRDISGKNKRYDRTIDLLEYENLEKGTPCFYVEYTSTDDLSDPDSVDNKRISFGHTPMFRLAYKKTIGEHIPEELRTEPQIIFDKEENQFTDSIGLDYASAMFGFVNSGKIKTKNEITALAGRLFFTDAVINPEMQEKASFANEVVPKTLGSPKPTSFQHYLEQSPNEEFDGKERKRNHYNSEANIRGYKLYWHKDIKDNTYEPFEENSEELKKKIKDGNDKIHTIIKPIKVGTEFKGKIYFENLSKKELGALLFVLNLPKECCNKIGMGKSLGLGSIQINSKVVLSDRKERYKSLLSEWNKNSELDAVTIQEIIKTFESEIIIELRKLGIQEDTDNYWDFERMQELKAMLDFENKPQNSKTRYMELKEFSLNPILSQPTKYKE